MLAEESCRQSWKWLNMALCAAGCRTGGVGLLKVVGALLFSSMDPDTQHEDAGFGVCSVGFQSCFDFNFSWYMLIYSFWNEDFSSVLLYIGRM